MFSDLLVDLLALAAILAGVSLLVQVLQELYKYASRSKPRLFRKVLRDFLGPYAETVLNRDRAINLQVRGPFEFRRRDPQGNLLPMDKGTLLAAVEQTAPPLARRALDALRLEAGFQQDGPPGALEASPAWTTFLGELRTASEGESAQSAHARELFDFFQEWAAPGDPGSGRGLRFDAGRALAAFRLSFLPHLLRVEDEFPQLLRNFDYAYQRRNLRQTFVFGFVVAALFNLPFDAIYRSALSMPPEEASRLAVTVDSLSARYDALVAAPAPPADPTDTTGTASPTGTAPPTEAATPALDSLYRARRDSLTALRDDLTASLRAAGLGSDPQTTYATRIAGAGSVWAVLTYLLGCLLTAVLVSFGAPFWNDLAGALNRLQQERRAYPPPPGAT